MPLTSKGHEIMAAMKEKYGPEHGEHVFYAARNAGTITGVDDRRADAATAAGVLFLTPENKVLYLKRGPGGDYPGTWCFPGGTTEGDETAEDTAKREAVEELGSLPDGDRELLTRQRMDVDYTTFLQRVTTEFVPTLNGEHTGYAWAPADQPPEPLHPGCRVALARLTMDELGVARAMAAGELTSPQRYHNVSLVDIRITGTGVSYRPKANEYVYRRPEDYLAPDFLARCNGLAVVMMHPPKAILDSDQYGKRSIGAIMLPYIKGDEVWGIAKVYDDRAVDLIERYQLTTSPGVLVGKESRMTVVDGDKLLIEDKPELLDHIAILPPGLNGVWDKGQPPSGVSSIAVGDDAMTEEERKAAEAAAKKSEEDRRRADAAAISTAVLQAVMPAITAIGTRVDSIEAKFRADAEEEQKAEEEKKAEEKKAADAAAAVRRFDSARRDRFGPRKDGETDKEYADRHDADERAMCDAMRADGASEGDARKDSARARKDAEEEEKKAAEKKKADAAGADKIAELQAKLAELNMKMPKAATDDDYVAMTGAQAKADAVYSQFGQQAPRPLAGETLQAYERRLTRGLQPHSPRWKDVDLTKAFADDAGFAIVQSQIYTDATTAAMHPTDVAGGVLRMITRRGPGGHTINEFRGEPRTWMDDFAGPVRLHVTEIFTPNRKAR